MNRVKLNNFAIETEKVKKDLGEIKNSVKDLGGFLGTASKTLDSVSKYIDLISKKTNEQEKSVKRQHEILDGLSKTTKKIFDNFLDKRLGKNIESAKELLARWSALKDTKKTLEVEITKAKESGKSARTIKTLGKQVVEVESSMGQAMASYKSALSKEFTKGFSATFMKNVGNGVKKLENMFLKFLGNIYDGAKKLTSEIASYNLSSSLFVNREAREQALRYGLSTSRNWAFTQAKSMLGITSDEDLYYMNQTQRTAFSELMTKYSAMYERLESSGYFSKTQEFQLRMKEFTLDAELKLVKFFAENGNTIMNIMNGLLSVGEFILNAVSSIYTFFAGGSTTTSGTTGVDLLANSTTKNNSVVINSNISATSTEQADHMIKSASDILWTPYIKALEN